VLAAFGLSSLPRSVCGPSASGVETLMHTRPYGSEFHVVPICTLSIVIVYDARPPSPARMNHGMLLVVIVGSEPICWLCRHVPSSSMALFVVKPLAGMAKNATAMAMAGAANAAATALRRVRPWVPPRSPLKGMASVSAERLVHLKRGLPVFPKLGNPLPKRIFPP
jgi:hypothetical protein